MNKSRYMLSEHQAEKNLLPKNHIASCFSPYHKKQLIFSSNEFNYLCCCKYMERVQSKMVVCQLEWISTYVLTN